MRVWWGCLLAMVVMMLEMGLKPIDVMEMALDVMSIYVAMTALALVRSLTQCGLGAGAPFLFDGPRADIYSRVVVSFHLQDPAIISFFFGLIDRWRSCCLHAGVTGMVRAGTSEVQGSQRVVRPEDGGEGGGVRS